MVSTLRIAHNQAFGVTAARCDSQDEGATSADIGAEVQHTTGTDLPTLCYHDSGVDSGCPNSPIAMSSSSRWHRLKFTLNNTHASASMAAVCRE